MTYKKDILSLSWQLNQPKFEIYILALNKMTNLSNRHPVWKVYFFLKVLLVVIQKIQLYCHNELKQIHEFILTGSWSASW